MIKAIIFDCFGVLVRGSLENFVDQYLSGNDDLVKEAYDLNHQCSLGHIQYSEMIQKFASMADLTVEKTHEIMDDNPRNTALIEYIRRELKSTYKIGFLSNAGENWLDELFKPEDVELFDDVVVSFEHNLAKPDPRIYELAAERLQVAPNECVFIDDIHSYVTGAQDVGMHAFQYINFADFKEKLQSILQV